jgi:AcrR family transcriptional regulator
MTTTQSASRTARERARAELTREIKQEARRQLAASGAQGLSLRSVSRELGMVSSALYRYFGSRDELLTALIIDAYDALGAAAEAASSALPAADIRGRWRACCAAIRDWALANPHEYALIYGSPVPGYQAPQATVASAVRVVRVMGGILADAGSAASDADGAGNVDGAANADGARNAESARGAGDRNPEEPLPADLARQVAIIGEAIAPGVDDGVLTRALIAWTQLFGMISFELFGQFVGSLEPAEPFFGYTVEHMADYIGLR